MPAILKSEGQILQKHNPNYCFIKDEIELKGYTELNPQKTDIGQFSNGLEAL